MQSASDRIVLLARQAEPIFHSGDLARLWDVHNSNTLYTLLKRYTKKGLLFRIYKGLYSLLPLEKLDPLLLGIKAIHGYAYISTETILVREGFIMQIQHQYTLVSAFSRSFRIGPYTFKSRQLQEKYLYNPAGIIEKNGVLKATPERALADLFYFNPKVYLDSIHTIDMKKFQALQKEIGYPFTPDHHADSA
ncbi:hypothetical protein HZA38_04875 [Candidatus Peregrinibacteria bacterium]|nr:hypothetical protein [Candidatus Peregrinibacteria bacterium]